MVNDGNIIKRSSQQINNLSFDETTGLQMAELAGTDGSNVYRVSVDSTGAVKTPSAVRFSGSGTTSGVTISASGDNTIYTPSAGKSVRLRWIGLSASQNNSAEVLATVKLGTKVVYEWYLGNPGAFAHWESVAANNPGDALIVNLSAAASVAVSYTVEEF